MARGEDQAISHGIERIETLIHAIETTADPATRANAEALVQALLEYHSAGIERMMDLVWEAGELGQALVSDAFVQDDLVSSMLLLHGLHPLDLEGRVLQALEKVRPYLGSHGGNVVLLGIDDGVVRLRLQGSCDGCPASQVTLKYAIEDAIFAVAPDVTAVEAEGVDTHPVERQFTAPTGIIPLMQVQGGNGQMPGGALGFQEPSRREGGSGWVMVNGLAALGAGMVRPIEVSGVPVLFCRVDTNLYAYGNTCPSCGQQLGQARLARTDLTCPTCGHRYDVLRAGRDLDMPSQHLDPFPLLEEHGQVRVALPALSRM